MSRILSHQAEGAFIRPRLRVFLSADLIGSTQFKIDQAAGHEADKEASWPNVTMLFYSLFQKLFFENCSEWSNRDCADSGEIHNGPNPKLWKVLGDELIFFKECWDPREVFSIIQVWRKTLIDFVRSWPYNNLKVKSGAWLVGTPIRNWEIAFLRSKPTADDEKLLNNPVAYNFHLLKEYYSDSENRKINIDFVGPSMDCGFRLLAHADERRLILSADLVEILCEEIAWWERQSFSSDYPPMKFYYSGTEELKGISKVGIKYPIIWLDNFDGAQSSDTSKYAGAIDKLDGRKPIADTELRQFMSTYLADMSGFPSRPYIARVSDEGAVANAHSELPEEDAKIIERYREIYFSNLAAEISVDDSLKSTESTKGSEPVDLAALLNQLLKPAADDTGKR